MNDQDLDEQLKAYRVAPAGLDLRQRIQQAARPHSPWAEWLGQIGGWRVAGPALALSVLCGVLSQLWWTQSHSDGAVEASVWSLAMLDSAQEWSDE